MAQIEVKVPQLSESVAEATLLSWHKKVGESVTRDENMIDIETDKVVLELPAPDSGVIAIIDTAATAMASPLPVTAAPVQAEAPATPEPAAAAAPAAGGSKGDVAMPAAAKILSEKGLSATDVAGSGKDGRVTKGDALAASAPAKAATPATKPAAAAKPAL